MPLAREYDPNVWSGQIDAMQNVGGGGITTREEVEAGVNVGYYNTGFTAGGLLRGLGTAISYGGAIAATIPAITSALRGSGGAAAAPQAAAAGPTSHPVLSAAPAAQGGGMVSTAIKAVEQIMDPAMLGGPSHAAVRAGRYAAAGTKGYHPIKKGPHLGLWVKNRHRNPCNIHALRRAISRAHSFEKIARKVIHFTHPRKATGTAHFVKRRRRA